MDTRVAATAELQKHTSQLALMRAMVASGSAASVVASNNATGTNTGGIGPVQTATFNLPPNQAKFSAKYLVLVTGAGIMDAVDLPGTLTILVNGTPTASQVPVTAGHVTADVGASLAWIVQIAHLPPPASLPVTTFGVQLAAGAGHTFTIVPGQMSVTIQELPG